MEPLLMDFLRGQSADPPNRSRQAPVPQKRTAAHTAGAESQGRYRETGGDKCKAQTENFLKQAKAQVIPQARVIGVNFIKHYCVTLRCLPFCFSIGASKAKETGE